MENTKDKPRTEQEVYMLSRLAEKHKRTERPKTREELLILLQIEYRKNELLHKQLERLKACPMDHT